MIRVLVVSPSSVTRRQLERVVAQDRGVVLAERRPDVIVLDPGPEPQVPLLLEQGPSQATTPLVLLLEDLEHEAAVRALRAGARAVLSRHAAPQEIRAAVRAAAAGLASWPAGLAGAVLDGKARDGGDGTLTPREREILTLLGEGLVNKEIAVRLGISEHTVKTHLAAIYEKLDASNRAEAVATGLRRGLIML